MQSVKYLFSAVSVLLLVGLSTATTAMAAEEQFRYAEKPWGLDSPAGRCVVCHSLEKNGKFRVAPNLWGIVGADKARNRKTYSYSKALLNKGGVWSAEEIDQFIADANKFLPGTTKSIKVKDAEERKQIVEFLKTLSD
ncbi:c-type cytochrome [Kaarinaea lacus]